MQAIDALRIEGTTHFGVLCYGVFSLSDLDIAHHGLLSSKIVPASKVYKLFAEQWPNGILLNEILVSEATDIPAVISTAISQMFDVGFCLFVVCMYDGAFGSYSDFFSSVLANQTYAFCFTRGQQVVNLDANLLLSKEWASIMSVCRKRLLDNPNTD
jgi:hypothetical protein